VLSSAVNAWPLPAATDNHLTPLSKADQLLHLTSRQLSTLDIIETSSLPLHALQAARASAALGWAEITCLCSSEELDVPGAHKLHLQGGLVGVTSNASNACHKQSNLPVLLGYLSRRYQYRGSSMPECRYHSSLHNTSADHTLTWSYNCALFVFRQGSDGWLQFNRSSTNFTSHGPI
jgi:hypothetical protein